MMMIKAFIVGVSLLMASAAWAAPTLTVNGSSSPITVAPGSTVAVAVAGGPGDSMDWIGLYETQSRDRAYIDYWYLTGTKNTGAGMTSATVAVVLPQKPGTYELRFFRFHERQFNRKQSNKLATSPSVRVQAVSVPVPPSIAPVTPAVVPVPPTSVPVSPAMAPVSPSDSIIMSPGLGYFDLPRTKALLWDVYHWRAAARDRSSKRRRAASPSLCDTSASESRRQAGIPASSSTRRASSSVGWAAARFAVSRSRPSRSRCGNAARRS